MKKLLLIVAIATLGFSGVFAQFAKDNSHGIRPVMNPSRAVAGGITSTSISYAVGTTFDIEFAYSHQSPDYEYTCGISMDFPAGVTVNSASDYALTYNGETGDGAAISWGDISGDCTFGALSGNATFTVNVTVGAAFTGDMVIAYNIVGDGYADAPHSLAGSITLTPAMDNDLAVASVSPTSVLAGQSATPKVSVMNMGSTAQDVFDIQVVINDGSSDVYTTIKNVTAANLAFGSTVEYTMTDEWTTPANGNYTITATVTLAGDANAANNQMVISCTVVSGVMAYAINGEAETFESVIVPTGAVTNISSFDVGNFPMAMEYANGTYYFIRNSPAELYTLDITDGSSVLAAAITGMTGTPTGIAYNWNTSTMYINFLDGSDIPHLGTIDLTTGVATEIGASTGMVIAMDFANDGTLYATTLDDNLATIDITTGAVTTVGPIGFDLNYGQDISFDMASGILYGIVYGGQVGLASFDLTTGAATILTPFTQQYACFAIPFEGGPYVTSVTPTNGATSTVIDATVAATFNVDITAVDLTGITITPNPGSVVASIVDNVLTIAHDDFAYNTVYTVTIPAGSISDGTDDLANDVVWSFTTMFDPTACNDPSDFIVTSVTPFEATISWTENGAGTQYNVVYGIAGFNPLTEGETVVVSANFIDLASLTADTDYEVYVQAICGAELSGWAGPAAFTTLYDCSTVTGLNEGFEMQVAPLCWDNYQAGAGTNVWEQETTIFNSGAACAVAKFEGSTGVNEQWLVTYEVNVPTSYRLMFYVRDLYTTDYLSTLTVKVSTDGGSVFTDLLALAETAVTNTAFTLFNIDLTAYEGQDVKFAFVMSDDDGDSWYLDDVVLDFYNGIEDNSNNEISIYPNPSNGLVNIAVTENSIVSVVDIAGRIISVYNVNANQEVNFTQSAGMYIVKVESNGKVSTHKLVIQ